MAKSEPSLVVCNTKLIDYHKV